MPTAAGEEGGWKSLAAVGSTEPLKFGLCALKYHRHAEMPGAAPAVFAGATASGLVGSEGTVKPCGNFWMLWDSTQVVSVVSLNRDRGSCRCNMALTGGLQAGGPWIVHCMQNSFT